MERFGQFWAADGDRIWKDLVKMELANYQRLPPSHYESLNLDLCVVVEYHLKPGSNDEYSLPISRSINSIDGLKEFLATEPAETLRGQILLLRYFLSPHADEYLSGAALNFSVDTQFSSISSYAAALIRYRWKIPGSSLQRLRNLDREATKVRSLILSQMPSLLKRKDGTDLCTPRVFGAEIVHASSYDHFTSTIVWEKSHCREPQKSTVNALHLDSESDGKPWRALVMSDHDFTFRELKSRFILELQDSQDEEASKKAEAEVKLRVQSPLCAP